MLFTGGQLQAGVAVLINIWVHSTSMLALLKHWIEIDSILQHQDINTMNMINAQLWIQMNNFILYARYSVYGFYIPELFVSTLLNANVDINRFF
jgi:hypothetical protein